ncbi:hypothetical protein [Agromyces neolithicus]|uniref:Uncharacterized protein n=1 Tax=Agromyces neolithicus TaxID=269420 RepID=A0ABP4YBR5_9MICO
MNQLLEHEIERWWPRLSIDAKHRLLAHLEDPETLIDAETAVEIEELVGAPVADRLTPAERTFIRTQIEAVD